VVALALAASAACLSQDVRVCSDGSVCPDFLACSPAGGCVEEALLCDVAGEPCTLPGGEAGLCRAGVCEQPRCGDRVIDEALGEMCDDGNALDGDGCARDCASDETCGNGVRDEDEGCDDGNVIDGDTCQAGCALPTCGDGILDDGEACDDGDANADDAACLPTCVAARCGDGRVQAGVEACDLGGANANDAACLPGCVAASCGDGHRWAVA
jgi:cysteine-rich repeat protein